MQAVHQRAESLRPVDSSNFAAIAFINTKGIPPRPSKQPGRQAVRMNTVATLPGSALVTAHESRMKNAFDNHSAQSRDGA